MKPPQTLVTGRWGLMFEEKALRDGIPIEKGVTLTKDFLDSNQPLFTKWLEHWLLYPDLFDKSSTQFA